MREILFKAKRLDNAEWIEGYYFQRPNDPIGEKHYIVTVGKCQWYEINSDTLCQFTGLTDKNGSKIWENDIVDVSDCWWTPNDITRHLVEWNETLSGFSPYADYDSDCGIYYCSENSKVAGNKFDNFELLERNFK